MATKKKGILTSSPEWWKHLKWVKRPFWKGERQAVRRDIKSRLVETNELEQDRRAYESREHYKDN